MLETVKGIKHEYSLNPELTVGRLPFFEQIGLEFSTRKTPQKVYEQFVMIWNALTGGNEAMRSIRVASDLAWNNMKAMEKVQEGEPNPALMLCTLFYNREGEDTSEWSEELAKEKIEDWKGIPVSFFFNASILLLGGLKDQFNALEEALKDKDALDVSN